MTHPTIAACPQRRRGRYIVKCGGWKCQLMCNFHVLDHFRRRPSMPPCMHAVCPALTTETQRVTQAAVPQHPMWQREEDTSLLTLAQLRWLSRSHGQRQRTGRRTKSGVERLTVVGVHSSMVAFSFELLKRPTQRTNIESDCE